MLKLCSHFELTVVTSISHFLVSSSLSLPPLPLNPSRHLPIRSTQSESYVVIKAANRSQFRLATNLRNHTYTYTGNKKRHRGHTHSFKTQIEDAAHGHSHVLKGKGNMSRMLHDAPPSKGNVSGMHLDAQTVLLQLYGCKKQ